MALSNGKLVLEKYAGMYFSYNTHILSPLRGYARADESRDEGDLWEDSTMEANTSFIGRLV